MVARLAGVLLLVFGLLPIANWIPGGHDAPWYADRMSLWTSGGAILAGVLVVSAIVFRRRPELWRDGLWSGIASRWLAGGWKADLGIALIACIAYAVVSQVVFSAKPLLIDEIIQVFQARIFAEGRLWIPTPEQPEFTAAMHLVDMEGRRFGQFPAGGPAMLMLGTLLSAEWLVGPIFAGVGVLVFARLLRRLAVPAGVALAAVLLFAFGPFWLFLGGSMMNHVTATTWLLVAALALAAAAQDASPRWRAALGCGLALGIAATIRPMDAVAFALPTAAWLLWRARLGGAHITALLASGVGVALPLVALLYVNSQQTGDPLLFAYEAMWGTEVGIGFHDAPWGEPHTPLRGLELVNLYLLRLQTYFLETPAPALLFATVSLLLVRRLEAFDRWVLVSSGVLLVSYWAYWHDGFHLGPRFLLPLVPWIALWTVRLPLLLAERGVAPWWRRGVVTAGVAALIMGATLLVPIRTGEYASSSTNLRFSHDSLVETNQLHDATILVRESWDAQLMARLWGIGVARSEAEAIYRTSDTCALDQTISVVERTGGDAPMLTELLAGVRADSALLTGLTQARDTTIKYSPNVRWTPACLERVREDEEGTAIFPTALLARTGTVRFVRDLHRRPPGTLGTLYLLRKPNTAGAGHELVPVSLDSAQIAWGRGE